MRDGAKRSLRLRFGGVGRQGGVYIPETGYKHHMQYKRLLHILILYLRLISVIQFDPKLPFASENFIDSPELCVLSEGRKEQMETALYFERKSEW